MPGSGSQECPSGVDAAVWAAGDTPKRVEQIAHINMPGAKSTLKDARNVHESTVSERFFHIF